MDVPGFKTLVQGDFHQGADIFSIATRGRQCVANCFIALAYTLVKPINNWTHFDMNSILIFGDELYKYIKSNKEIFYPYLQVNHLPSNFIHFENVYISHKVLNTYSGYLNSGINLYPLVSLESALNLAFAHSKFCIFITCGYSVSICQERNTFFLFDSHARNTEGASDSQGNSTVIEFSNFCNLCFFLRNSVHNSNQSIQFEINVLRLQTVSKKHVVNKKTTICSLKSPLFRDANFISNSVSCQLSQSNLTPLSINLSIKEGKTGQKKKVVKGKNKNVKQAAKKSKNYPTSHATQSSHTHTVVENVEDIPSISSNINTKNEENATSFTVTSGPSVKKKVKRLHQTEKSKLCNIKVKDASQLIQIFKYSVDVGPDYVCSCCRQTWFRHSVSKAECVKHSSLAKSCLNRIQSVDNIEWVCFECKKYLNSNKIPPFSKVNGMEFPSIPPELELTPLEERLITPRLLFMQIRQKPRGGQQSLKGNIVNVPTDVNTTIKKLPRTLSNDETILVKLKRDTNMKNWVQFQPIRPAKVLEAAKWLVSNSDLFKNEGISLDEHWMVDSVFSEENDSDEENASELSSKSTTQSRNCNQQKITESDSDDFSENDENENKPSGNMDTVMHPVDFREFNQILSLAPGEGKTPVGIFQDTNSEFLAFPTIYCGEKRQDNNKRKVPLHYSSICKWELRNVDRRVSKCIPNLFYKMKRLQIKQIKDKVNLAIRKCKTKGKRLTVGDIISPGGIDKIIKLDEGYRVLRNLRGSPPYWEQAKMEIFAMIRQLGIPTWFISLSAAETRWTALLKILGRIAYKKNYTDEKIESLSWEEKCKLIRSDAINCVRYFDFRSQKFMAIVLNDAFAPVGEISDFFKRIEFQQRGSPHIHMLVWVKGAPTYGVNSDDEVIEFLNKYVSCKKDPDIPELINYQTHRHARTCRKKGKAICRFNFPLPPMPETTILKPLKDFENTSEVSSNYTKISELLNQMKLGEDISFSEFLRKLDFDFEKYILAVRSSIKSDKIFLKREPSEIRINNYNATLLKAWEANLDIQYILDPYACAAYIVSYISKGQRGMSNLLYQACKEARKEESDIRQQVRRVGNQFLNHQEVGAQEAAYLVLQIPLRRCSRTITFVNTSDEENRTVLLKSISDMEQLPSNSLDIESDNSLKRYQRRPKCLELCCLADFVAWFNFRSSKEPEEVCLNDQEYLPENDYVENLDDDDSDKVDDDEMNDDIGEDEEHVSNDLNFNIDTLESGTVIMMKNGSSFIKRKTQKILRYVRYNIELDRENHFRELLMLFYHWRKEEKIIGSSETFELQYHKVIDSVAAKRQEYEKSICLEDIHEDFDTHEDIDTPEVYNSIAPSTEHNEAVDRASSDNVSELYSCFFPGDGCLTSSDIGPEIGLNTGRIEYLGPELISTEMPDLQYRKLVQSLNRGQKEFFYHVLHLVKMKENPFYNFLSGGGGVGKSVVIRCLYQALLKYFLHELGEDPDQIKLLLCAPTGKAAYNINGNTLHSTFCIPVGQKLVFKPLAMHQLSSMQAKFLAVKVLFIDEISMVGCNMFNFINLRLQEVKCCTKPFGGISIIVVGDLFQLKPVMDKWIFDNLDRDYGPLGSNLWKDHFSMFELTQIMRQKDDCAFAEILNRFREGKQTSEDMTALCSRLTVNEAVPKHLPRMFTTKAEVSLYNNNIFASVDASLKTIVSAIDSVTGDLSDNLRETIRSKIPNDPSKTMGLTKDLPLAVGLPAEICINVDVEDGLTNGTPGIIKKLDFRVQGSSRCSIVWMEFEDSKIGQRMRAKFKYLYTQDIELGWTPILEITKKFTFMYYKPYHIVRRQFPVHLAAARTIHKAQGATFENAVVHFGKRKTDHIHYVGLSRVKNLSNLHILDLVEEKISVSRHVQSEMQRLRTIGFVSCIPSLDMLAEDQIKIVFHNARSLHKHIEDVRCDYNLVTADVLVIAETQFSKKEPDSMYLIENFQKPIRYDGESTESGIRSPYGIAVYLKKNIQNFQKFSKFGSDIVMFSLILDHENTIQLCFLYCKPKHASLSNLQKLLHYIFKEFFVINKPFIIMGDFNYDLMKCRKFEEWISKSYHCSQLISSFTTDYKSCLDHVYTNIQNVENYGTLESYFSDHKPIYFASKLDELSLSLE